jgi:hypothetical protein
VQSLILLDFRTVALCAALVATSEAVLAHDATSQFETSIIESRRSIGDEPAKDSALDIPADLWLVPQSLLARSARLGSPCGSQRVRNSRNEPHSGPIELPRVDLCLEKESFDHSRIEVVAEPRVFLKDPG